MKAVQLTRIGQPLELREIPIPPIGAGQVLVRIRAAGICHSDAHYRAGASAVGPLPQTLGHEVSGVVEAVGEGVTTVGVGDRVCLHYLLACGDCFHCSTGNEQFCSTGSMIGKYVDGGYAEYIAVPARNAVILPDEISFKQGAVLMCSASTSLHALRKTRLKPGETIAVYGVGGLGIAAIQLAKALGALDIYAVDINPAKLSLAESYGAIPIDAAQADPVRQIRQLTNGRGVDVALELIGLPETMSQAVRSLAVLGRAGLVGIGRQPLSVDTYPDVLGREAEIIGCSDHLLQELPMLLEYARRGVLDLESLPIETVPLEAEPVNRVLDALASFNAAIRTVILPE